jgi:hypothetical protein
LSFLSEVLLSYLLTASSVLVWVYVSEQVVFVLKHKRHFMTPVVKETLAHVCLEGLVFKLAFEEDWYFVRLDYLVVLGVVNHIYALKVDVNSLVFRFFV